MLYPRVWTSDEERLFQEIGRRLGDADQFIDVSQFARESESKLGGSAQRIAQVGHWNRDFDADRITLSDEARRIFGLSPEETFATPGGLA